MGRSSHICLSQRKQGGCQPIVWKNRGDGRRSEWKRSALFSTWDGLTSGGSCPLPHRRVTQGHVLVSKGRCSKLPPARWLRTTEISFPPVLEAAGLMKSRHQRVGTSPCGNSRGASWPPPAPGGTQCPLACGSITPIPGPVHTQPLPCVFSSRENPCRWS